MSDYPSKPQEADYIIAYIDILGTKEKLTLGNWNEFFEKLYDLYVVSTEELSTFEFMGFNELKFKIFSDNIVVALKIENINDKNEICNRYICLSNFLKIFLNHIANDGTLFRGAITINKLCIDDIIVWGKGLLEVVFLEEEIAIYPRVILSDTLEKHLMNSVFSKDMLESKYSCMFDTDGYAFFDYLTYDTPAETMEVLKDRYSILEEKIRTESRPKILQKYLWYKNYLERVREKFNDEWSNIPYRIEW